ncbi:hypothetical protein K469DRAFT_291645 [Zopfia rhizophila CBS 207.26]|uniref:Uncharacterized protein n=1 Tax=Zopfia rhizophila CBS 207.26 TaxID=1314779 RepID=A0A6A6DPV9_9PEZI|nr:hypothetical protein K469DRAFT_291645 [Zopfia rhizophila CBS 207.26]
MCTIIPIDHLSCTHTVAIWHHCRKAPRTKLFGPAPCGRIKQHSRPIMTKKLCYNCGGPRIFPTKSMKYMTMGMLNDGIDSGYESGSVIVEEEEEDEDQVPSSTGNDTGDGNMDDEAQAWPPNLKKELQKQNGGYFFPLPDIPPLSPLKFEDAIGRAWEDDWLFTSHYAHPTSPPSRERRNAIDIDAEEAASIVESLEYEDMNEKGKNSLDSTSRTGSWHPNLKKELEKQNGGPIFRLSSIPPLSPIEFEDGIGRAWEGDWPSPHSFSPSFRGRHSATDIDPEEVASIIASSAYSDYGDSEDMYEEEEIEESESHLLTVSLARTAKMGRASRISFHGGQLRVLESIFN